MVDMAHFAGLVAGKVFTGDEDPIPHAHVVTTTTHKSLRGPRGGLVLATEEYSDAVDRGCPMVLGGPLSHVMAAKAVALAEARQPEFQDYAAQVADNAQSLAEGFTQAWRQPGHRRHRQPPGAARRLVVRCDRPTGGVGAARCGRRDEPQLDPARPQRRLVHQRHPDRHACAHHPRLRPRRVRPGRRADHRGAEEHQPEHQRPRAPSKAKYTLGDGVADRVKAASAELLDAQPALPRPRALRTLSTESSVLHRGQGSQSFLTYAASVSLFESRSCKFETIVCSDIPQVATISPMTSPALTRTPRGPTPCGLRHDAQRDVSVGLTSPLPDSRPAAAIAARRPLSVESRQRRPRAASPEDSHDTLASTSHRTGTGRAPPRPRKGEGQWALGYREPLNANEQAKKDDDALNVRARIENIYAHGGFASIDPSDLRSRFRWWGLYTQRKPGIDGGRTAVLEPHELDDEYFMLRVRIDGGQLTTAQLRDDRRHLDDVRPRHRRHHRPAEHPAALDPRRGRPGDLEPARVGRPVDRRRPAATRPRVVLGSPLAGIAADELIDPTPAIREIFDRYIGVTGVLEPAAQVQDRDHRSPRPRRRPGGQRPRVRPDRAPRARGRLRRLGRRRAVDEPDARAERSASGCRSTRSADVWRGVISVFRDYGYRRLRARARLKFLVADWGVEKFREVLEDEYLHRDAGRRRAPGQADRQRRPRRRARAEGRPLLRRRRPDRRSGLRHDARASWPTSSRRTGRPGSAPRRTRSWSSSTSRTTASTSLVEAVEDLGLAARPSQWRRVDHGLHRHRVLQARDRRDQGPRRRARRRARAAHPRARHPDHGAPSTAAPTRAPGSRSPTSGSRASSSSTTTATRSRASRSTSAAGSGSRPASAASCAPTRSRRAGLTDYVERLVRTYLDEREDGERFASWALRADEEALR